MLKRISLAEQTRDELLRMIVEGELAPGEKLAEETLGAKLGVSRTPLRDALLHLERDGLVERTPGRGYRVGRVDRETADELMRCRKAIELLILNENFSALPRAELRALRDRLAAPEADPETALNRSLEIDDAIHAMIGDLADNRFLREIHANLVRRTLSFRDFRNLPRRTPVARLDEERLRLLDALLSGDAAHAAAELERHLDNGREGTLNAMKDL